MNEGEDRNGRRGFCAQFDRNPKWGKRYNVSSASTPTTDLPTWSNSETDPAILSRFYPAVNDQSAEDDDEEDDDEDDDWNNMDTRMLNIF